jgi:hypothetical protein
MKLSTILFTIAVGTSVAWTASNAITYPTLGQSFDLSATHDRPTTDQFSIKWTPAPMNEIPRVHIYLRKGGPGSLHTIGLLAMNVPNIGSFQWDTAPFINTRLMPSSPEHVDSDTKNVVNWQKVSTSSAYSLEIVPAIDYSVYNTDAERRMAATVARDNTNYSPFFTLQVHDNEHSFKWDNIYTTANSVAQEDEARAEAERSSSLTQLENSGPTGSASASSSHATTATTTSIARPTSTVTIEESTTSTPRAGSATTAIAAATTATTSGGLVVKPSWVWVILGVIFGVVMN